MNSGYSICFNRWVLDLGIKNELRLLLIISSLTAQNGYCFASNKYFAELFDETEVSISKKIKKLEKKNYIEIEYEKRGAEVVDRKIRLKNILIDDYKNFYSTIKKNFKDNNISINNTSINKKEIYKERFKKPSLEEIEQYITENKMNVNPQTFYKYFTESNWVDSNGKKVKNWKQKIITWNSYSKNKKTKENVVPEWFDKDLNKKEKIKEDDLNDKERELINKILGSN